MQTRFPSGDAAWRERITRMILDTDVAIKRLWQNFPQVPDPEMGMPFTGPLDPTSFRYPPFDRSGGTNTGGTTTGGTIPRDGTLIVATGGTGGCGACSDDVRIVCAGVTDSGATSYDDTYFNGSHTCLHVGSCIYREGAYLWTGVNSIYWEVSYAAGADGITATTMSNGSPIMFYGKTGAGLACSAASHTLTRIDFLSNPFLLAFYPTTITVEWT